MAIIGNVCMFIGIIIGLIYGIQLIILAFRESILWGLGYLFVPFVSLIFLVVHWDEAKSPFLKSLFAIPFYIIASLLMQPS